MIEVAKIFKKHIRNIMSASALGSFIMDPLIGTDKINPNNVL